MQANLANPLQLDLLAPASKSAGGSHPISEVASADWAASSFVPSGVEYACPLGAWHLSCVLLPPSTTMIECLGVGVAGAATEQ